MGHLSAERCRQGITEHMGRLAEAIGAAGGNADVPTCADWAVADLVAHIGQVLHWVAQIVEQRIADPALLATVGVPDLPDDESQWPAWLTDAAARAVAALDDEALEASVFNPAADERTGGRFWLESMLNESVVHGADAAAAAAIDLARGFDIDADVAAACITFNLAMFTSTTWAAQRPESAAALSGTGETLHWHADDPALGPDGEWLVERRPDGAVWQPRHDPADVTVHGPARSLLLVLTRRLAVADAVGSGQVTVEGDAALVDHWVASSAHVAG